MGLIEYLISFFKPPKPISQIPVEFKNLTELKLFLDESKINLNKYVNTTYDCDDFARELQIEALKWRDGRILNVQTNDSNRHMFNNAIIAGKVYKIEPQTDEVTLLCSLD